MEGNNKTMREALERLKPLCQSVWESGGGEDVSAEIAETMDIIKASLAAPARPCDTMGWRDAWAKWRTEVKPQKPETYGEAYEGTAAFMDWFMTPQGSDRMDGKNKPNEKTEVVEVKRWTNKRNLRKR